MVGLETGLRLVGGAALLLGNAFFVTSEFAMTRVPQFEKQEFQGVPGLERAWAMTEELEVYLSGCQVGITVCSVGLGVVAEPAIAAVLAAPLAVLGITAGGGHTAVSAVVALTVINLLHVVIGEQTPTYLGVERAKTVAGYTARPLYWWTWLMSPVIRFADWTAKAILKVFNVEMTRSWHGGEGELTREELRAEMGSTLAQTKLSEERRQEVINALEIGGRTVGDIMVDREDIVALHTEASFEENLTVVQAHPQYTRFPLVEGEFESFEGIVYVGTVISKQDALAAGETTLSTISSQPMVLTLETTVSDAIDAFQAQNQELALVLDDGVVVGLLTATDAFEAIAGDLEDPLDKAAETS